jgi:hypothetical protein
MKTSHYDVFNAALGTIRKTASSSDDFTNKLLFANVVTVFEAYLQGIVLSLMQSNNNSIRCKHRRNDSNFCSIISLSITPFSLPIFGYDKA